MDTIRIHELQVQCRIGVPAAERATPQPLLVSVEMALDLTAAARSDDLTDTIDYAAVAQRIEQVAAGRSWQLIESFAGEIAQMILDEFPARQVTVEVQKFILPRTRAVSVRLTRTSLSNQNRAIP